MNEDWFFWIALVYVVYLAPGTVKSLRRQRDLADDLSLIGTIALAVSLLCWGGAKLFG